jgi:hypothetical protein
MAILIKRVESGYVATATPPHVNGGVWETSGPLPARGLTEELRRRGCHQQDIGDALYEADSDWMLRLRQADVHQT